MIFQISNHSISEKKSRYYATTLKKWRASLGSGATGIEFAIKSTGQVKHTFCRFVCEDHEGAFASLVGSFQADPEGLGKKALPMKTFASKKTYVEIACIFMCGVEQGVAVLHENDIIHYDLKCDNVMVEVNKKCPGSNLPLCRDLPEIFHNVSMCTVLVSIHDAI